MRDVAACNRMVKAKWDWFLDTIITMRPWANWRECNLQNYNAMPIKVILPDLHDDLWSRKALSGITSTLGKSIGVQRMGCPRDRPSALLGILVSQSFTFPEEVVFFRCCGWQGSNEWEGGMSLQASALPDLWRFWPPELWYLENPVNNPDEQDLRKKDKNSKRKKDTWMAAVAAESDWTAHIATIVPTTMALLEWNTRGMNKDARLREIKTLIAAEKWKSLG